MKTIRLDVLILLTIVIFVLAIFFGRREKSTDLYAAWLIKGVPKVFHFTSCQKVLWNEADWLVFIRHFLMKVQQQDSHPGSFSGNSKRTSNLVLGRDHPHFNLRSTVRDIQLLCSRRDISLFPFSIPDQITVINHLVSSLPPLPQSGSFWLTLQCCFFFYSRENKNLWTRTKSVLLMAYINYFVWKKNRRQLKMKCLLLYLHDWCYQQRRKGPTGTMQKDY